MPVALLTGFRNFPSSKVRIYKRKQESKKKERKYALDQEKKESFLELSINLKISATYTL